MNHKTLLSVLGFLAASLLVVQAGPKDEITAAVKKLGKADSYGWNASTEGSRWSTGTTEGKVGKDGSTWLKMTRGDNTFEAAVHGEKGVMKTDAGWQTLEDLRGDGQNRGRFLGYMIRNYDAPVSQAKELLEKAAEFKMEDGAYAAQLSEEGVKEMLTFRRRDGSQGPIPTNTGGWVKFWIKDGTLAKYEFNVQGKMSFNNNDFDIDRTTTVELKEIGSTQVDLPDEVKDKLS
jgi:hypothetical protein